jgi:hypothetical protein
MKMSRSCEQPSPAVNSLYCAGTHIDIWSYIVTALGAVNQGPSFCSAGDRNGARRRKVQGTDRSILGKASIGRRCRILTAIIGSLNGSCRDWRKKTRVQQKLMNEIITQLAHYERQHEEGYQHIRLFTYTLSVQPVRGAEPFLRSYHIRRYHKTSKYTVW